MQRYPYRQQPQMVDTGDVPYISYTSEQAEPLMMQAAANAQQRYDLAQTAIAKYLEENAAAKFRDADYNTAMAKLNQDLENIKTTVKDRYDGQYWQAYPEILKGLSKARQTYHLAQKAYEEEQKYAPLITKLAAEKKLIFAPNAKGEVIDPRTQSVFDETGQYRGGLDYSNIRERSDYDKTIEEAIVKGIDKTSDDTGLGRRLNGYFEQIKTKGLAALGNTPDEINKKVRELAEQYTPIFEAQTTYGIDPNKPMESSTDFIEKTIHRLAGSDRDVNYREDVRGNYLWKKGLQEKNNPELKIFGEDFRTRIEKNPFVEEVGSYKQALNPSTWDNFIGTFTGNKELVKFKGGVNNIDDAISILKDTIEKGKNNMDKRDLNRIKTQLNKYESIKDDLDAASETLKSRLAYQTYGDDYYNLPAETKKLIDSKIPSGTAELADLLDADNQILANSSSTSRTILHPITQKMVKQEIMSKIEDMSFGTSSGATSSYFNDVVESLGVAPERARQYLAKNNIIPSYHKSKGQYYIDIPTNLNKKGEPNIDDPKYKKLYFTLDETSTNVVQGISKAILNNAEKPVILSDNKRYTFKYEPSLNKDRRNKAERKIQVFDLYGNPIRDNEGKNYYIGLETLQDWMQDYQNNLLASQYTLPFMNKSDQQSNPEIVD